MQRDPGLQARPHPALRPSIMSRTSCSILRERTRSSASWSANSMISATSCFTFLAVSGAHRFNLASSFLAIAVITNRIVPRNATIVNFLKDPNATSLGPDLDFRFATPETRPKSAEGGWWAIPARHHQGLSSLTIFGAAALWLRIVF